MKGNSHTELTKENINNNTKNNKQQDNKQTHKNRTWGQIDNIYI